MRNRAIRPFAAILSVLLLAAASAQAGPATFGDVVQVFGDQQRGGHVQELRLRSVSQLSSTPISSDIDGPDQTSTQQDGDAASVSLIATNAGPQEGQQGTIEVIEGDVSGTVCDCGEIRIPGGFKFPWLALAGVPLICATGICTSDRCVGPDCKPCVGDCGSTVIPEPATLMLLGSGLAALGARARRRYRLTKPGGDLPNSTEV